jgi:Holliday junction resolvase RusA-like endonuclease
MIKFTANIVPQPAIRMTRGGKYTDPDAQRYLRYKAELGWLAKKHFRQWIEGPIVVNIVFYMPIMPSWTKKKQRDAQLGLIRPEVIPDIDNLLKGVFDSLNKIAWKDDGQVIESHQSQWYSDKPRVEIEVIPWRPDEL